MSMARHDISPVEMAVLLQEHVLKLSSQEIMLLQFWLLVELLRRCVDYVALVMLCLLTAVLQGRYRVDLSQDDLQVEREVVRPRVPIIEASHSKCVDRAEEYHWRQYFADPSQWWDNQENKRNPRCPDFKHKVTRKALWIDGWYTPDWVSDRLRAS